jgi:cytochrome c oxidase subunit 2
MSGGAAVQSALDPAGAHAAAIHQLWSVMLWVSSVVFVVVLAFIAVAVVYGRRRQENAAIPATAERSLTRSVAAAVAATVVILIALLVASIWTDRAVASAQPSGGSAVSINLTGHQWWWEVEYEDATPSQRMLTANELHVPVGRPVVLKVTSRDVIHSFWAPNLQGKRDLIPGYTTAIWLRADRPGTFRGQCAEYCGMQHAHMAIDVVAEPDADFERWLDARREPARPPASDAAQRGQSLFMKTRCAGCHTIKGTDAAGTIAPDLTHVAARGTLGAGTLPNSAAELRAWIHDPQASKLGNKMPANPFEAADLDALVAYLSTLK